MAVTIDRPADVGRGAAEADVAWPLRAARRRQLLVLIADPLLWCLVLVAMISVDQRALSGAVVADAAALTPLVSVLYHGVLRVAHLAAGPEARQSADWFLAAAVTALLVIALDAVWNVTATPATHLGAAAVLAGAIAAFRALGRYFAHNLERINVDGLSDATAPRGAPAYAALKRGVDIVGAAVGGLCLLPMIAAVALAVRVTSPGPILFRQQRIGRGGERFTIYKFRSMRDGGAAALLASEEARRQYEENDFKLPDELAAKLVTPIGKVLRKTSIDELPQLWNVLRGEMSIVGPRPIVDDELANYGAASDAYLGAKPGLTGAWQVSGRSDVGYPERVDFDVFYWVHRSFALDLYLTLKTVPALLFSRGAR